MHTTVVDRGIIQNEISTFLIDFAEANWDDARNDYSKLSDNLKSWKAALSDEQPAEDSSISVKLVPNGIFAPILIYHKMPADFESQLKYLQSHGYTAITMDDLADALLGHPHLPAKPVVITFDDGYTSQMQALSLIEKYQMKATFYIIIDRANSGCETPNPHCNPDYLSWDQVRQIDDSGYATIGDHTVSHPNLAGLSAVQQQTEISQAKSTLEAKLGHKIDQFAYPYGSYNDTTVKLVKANGFRAAVSTIAGTYQSPDYLFTLHRIRTVYSLP